MRPEIPPSERLAREERVALGITDDDAYETVYFAETPREPTTEQRSIAEARAMLSEARASTAIIEIALGADKALQLRSWDHDPAVVLLEVPDVSRLSWTGTAGLFDESQSAGPGTLIVSAESASLVVRDPDEDGELRFLLRDQRIRIVRVAPRREQTTALVLPEGRELLDGLETEPWLDKATAKLAMSPSLLDRVIAVGLVCRLWEPPRAAVTRSLQYLLGGHTSPADRALEWAKNLAPGQRSLVGRLTLDAIDAWCEELDSFATVVIETPQAAQLLGAKLLLRRDDLESVRMVLQLAGEDELIGAALAGLDRRAAAQLSAFSSLAALDDPRLAATFRTQPWAWWAIASDARG